MVVRVPKSRMYTFDQLIERDAKRILHERNLPLWKYISFKKAAFLMRMQSGDFYQVLEKSKTLKAFIVETGEIFVHPDPLLKCVKIRGRNFAAKVCNGRRSTLVRFLLGTCTH